MPTWFVVYLAGHLLIAAGPVPDTAACLQGAAVLSGSLSQALGKVDVYVSGRRVSSTDIHVTCISSADRPR